MRFHVNIVTFTIRRYLQNYTSKCCRNCCIMRAVAITPLMADSLMILIAC